MSNHDGNNTPAPPPEDKDIPLAKLSMPRLARGIARPRLYNLLDESRKKATVWIVAPGGAGKTTLTATYIAERKLPFLWYQVDKDDADPATFFYYLGLAAKNIPSQQEAFLPLLTPEYLPDIPGFARRYFRDLFALLPRGAVLVLDNHQDVTDAGLFTELLRSAMSEIPAYANIIVISRVDPPPELARLQAIGALDVIDWEDLRLTLDETQAVVSNTTELDPEIVRALHEKSEGWVAGLILLVEQMKRKGDIKQVFSAGSLQTIFDFFASEFFDHLPDALRDFLLKTALLPHFTPALAEEVSGNRDAGQILADLHHRHLFTNRRDLAEVTYQYHALFREFLLARLAQTYTRAQYLDLARRVGQLLGELGRNEEAVALYLQAKDWMTAIPLILAQAPVLLAQGRAQTVVVWILQLPQENAVSTPWLMFWKGVCQQFGDPFAARASLEQAYVGFSAAQDVMGQALTASATIDIIYFSRQNFLLTIPWVEALQKYLAANLIFPLPTIEARILTSLVSVLMFIRPQDPQLPHYADRLQVLLDYDLDINQKVWSAGHTLYYCVLIRGDIEACNRIMTQIMPLIHAPELTVLNQIFWRHMCIFPYVLQGRVDEADEINRPVNVLVKENNLHFMEFIASVYSVYVSLNLNDLHTSKLLLDRMGHILDTSQPIDVSWYHSSKSLYAQAQGNHTSALDSGLASLETLSKFGMKFIEMEMSCLIALACCESGKPEDSLEYLMMPRNLGFGSSPHLRHQVFLIEAYAYLLQGDIEKCLDRLNEALLMGRKQRYFGSIFCIIPGKILTLLCAEALRADIEVTYVQQLVRKRGLLPEDPSIEIWPWPIRIYSLGRFQLTINDQLHVVESKSQRKPLSLLEVLIALGGKEVKEERITEILWPEAEGDAAHSAFTTNLSRLRKLIGEETITVKNGRVSLDEHRCWVDAWALERHLDQADKVGAKPADVRALAEKLMALYRGPFLGDEEWEWPRRMRNRLRLKLSRFFAQAGRTLSAAGEMEQAVLLFEQALEVDPGAEDFYRALIALYAGSGRNAEALVAYARCREILSHNFGIAPSQETEALYRSIESTHFPLTESSQTPH